MSTIWEGVDAEALQQHKAALPYWLQEAKERGEREQRLKEDIREVISIWENMADFADPEDVVDRMVTALRATLYPDTPAPKEGE